MSYEQRLAEQLGPQVYVVHDNLDSDLAFDVSTARKAPERDGRPAVLALLPVGHGEPVLCVQMRDFPDLIRAFVGYWAEYQHRIEKALRAAARARERAEAPAFPAVPVAEAVADVDDPF